MEDIGSNFLRLFDGCVNQASGGNGMDLSGDTGTVFLMIQENLTKLVLVKMGTCPRENGEETMYFSECEHKIKRNTYTG